MAQRVPWTLEEEEMLNEWVEVAERPVSWSDIKTKHQKGQYALLW